MKSRFNKWYVLLFLLFATHWASGQVTFALLQKEDTLYKVKASIEEKDSLLQQWVKNFQSEGYFEVQLLQEQQSDETATFRVKQGIRYRWGSIVVPEDLPISLERQAKALEGTFYQQKKADKVLKALVQDYAEKGFPFASAQWGAFQIKERKVNTSLSLSAGTPIVMDTLKISPKQVVKPLFLASYLGLYPGKPYDESAIQGIRSRLLDLPFLNLVDTPRISFQNQQATPYLQVKPVAANALDAFLGVFPKGNNAGVQLTGHVALEFPNLFRSGKSFSLQWEQFQKGAQMLHVRYLHRGFLHSPWGIWGSVDLLNQDSTFQKNTLQLGAQWNSVRNWQFSGAINRIKSEGRKVFSPVDPSTASVPSFEQNGLWLKAQWKTVKNIPSPQKGWIMQGEIAGGNRSYPDSLTLGKQFAGDYRLEGQYFWPVGNGNIWYNRMLAAGVWGTHNAPNELLRLGGLATLRGFNEQQFFLGNYVLWNTEWRKYWAENSFVYGFVDVAALSFTQEHFFEQWAEGVGVGFQFDTNAGHFKLAYAVGKTKAQPVDFRQAKIHFGYVTVF